VGKNRRADRAVEMLDQLDGRRAGLSAVFYIVGCGLPAAIEVCLGSGSLDHLSVNSGRAPMSYPQPAGPGQRAGRGRGRGRLSKRG